MKTKEEISRNCYERLNLYLQGLFLGLIVAVLAMRLKLGKMLKAKTPKVCAFVVIA